MQINVFVCVSCCGVYSIHITNDVAFEKKRKHCVCVCEICYIMSSVALKKKKKQLKSNSVSWNLFLKQVLGTDELNAYLHKYRIELDPHLAALVGR